MRIVIVFILISFISCTKEKRYENRLEGERWFISLFTVDGNIQGNDGTELSFDRCKNTKELCTGTLGIEDEQAEFYWRFHDKGKRFEISNQTFTELGVSQNRAAKMCYEISGKYEVLSFKRNSFEMESTNTYGFPGQTVKLVIRPSGQ